MTVVPVVQRFCHGSCLSAVLILPTILSRLICILHGRKSVPPYVSTTATTVAVEREKHLLRSTDAGVLKAQLLSVFREQSGWKTELATLRSAPGEQAPALENRQAVVGTARQGGARPSIRGCPKRFKWHW